jgi:hypothetical protein
MFFNSASDALDSTPLKPASQGLAGIVSCSLWSGRLDYKPRERLYHRRMRHHVRHTLEPPVGVILVVHRLVRDLWAADLTPALPSRDITWW